MEFPLMHNVYSPKLLAEEFRGIIKKGAIYRAIKAGKLVARRTGGKNIIIFHKDIQAWLANLPSATAPTNLGGSKDKPAKPDKKRKTASEVAHEYQHRQRMAVFRRESRR